MINAMPKGANQSLNSNTAFNLETEVYAKVHKMVTLQPESDKQGPHQNMKDFEQALATRAELDQCF